MSLLQRNWLPGMQINWQQSVFSGALCGVQHQISKQRLFWTERQPVIGFLILNNHYIIATKLLTLINGSGANGYIQPRITNRQVKTQAVLLKETEQTQPLAEPWEHTRRAACQPRKQFPPGKAWNPVIKTLSAARRICLGVVRPPDEARALSDTFTLRIRRRVFLKNLSTHPKSTLLHFNMTSFTVGVGSFTTCRINIGRVIESFWKC